MTNTCVLVLLLFACSGIAMTSKEDGNPGSGHLLNIANFPEKSTNYITTAFLPDGESEIRMRFGDTIVREAAIAKPNESGVRRGLLLRQMASGPHVLQLIYKVGEGRASKREVKRLVECEMIDDWGSADQFRNQFREDLFREGVTLEVPPNHFDYLKSDSNVTSSIGEDISLEEMELAEGDTFNLDQGVEQFKNITVRILRNDEIVGELQQTFDMIAQQKRCRRLHRKMKKSAKQGLVDETSNTSDDVNDASDKKSRRVRREAFRVGIMPGTLWCGDGSLADRYEDMGAHVGTDRCCREHDGCPFIIHGMTSNYGMFNYRMHTVSHCTCDERFRSCLKQTNTGSSNFVGKLFFNVVQTKCFVLKPERICTKRSWWGKCLKYEFRKQAHVREPIPY